MKLICKWGCDKTSGQSSYKQKFVNGDGSKTDAGQKQMQAFFSFPLQLIHANASTNSQIVWKNSRPLKLNFCMKLLKRS